MLVLLPQLSRALGDLLQELIRSRQYLLIEDDQQSLCFLHSRIDVLVLCDFILGIEFVFRVHACLYEDLPVCFDVLDVLHKICVYVEVSPLGLLDPLLAVSVTLIPDVGGFFCELRNEILNLHS